MKQSEQDKLEVARNLRSDLQSIAADMRGRKLPAASISALPDVNAWMKAKGLAHETQHWRLCDLLKMAGTMDPEDFDKQLVGSDLQPLKIFQRRRLQNELADEWHDRAV